MNLVRTTVAIALIALLGGGYFASQYAYFLGNPIDYKNAVDVPAIKWLALALFAAIIGLASLRVKEESA